MQTRTSSKEARRFTRKTMKAELALLRLYLFLIVSLIIDWESSIRPFPFALAEPMSNREAIRKRKLLETERPKSSKECMKDCSLGTQFHSEAQYSFESDNICHELVLFLFFLFLFPAFCNITRLSHRTPSLLC